MSSEPQPLKLTEGRECGNCKLCCKVMAVGVSPTNFEPEIGAFKPGGTWCPRSCDIGCSIHSTRPQACRDFRCAWLRGIVDEKPDRCRIVVSLENGPKELDGPWWVLYEGLPRQVLSPIGDRLCERLLRIVIDPEGVRPVVRMDTDYNFTHIRRPGRKTLGPWEPITVNIELEES